MTDFSLQTASFDSGLDQAGGGRNGQVIQLVHPIQISPFSLLSFYQIWK